MAVNRFDRPAEANFINTFVPLPFDQMYQLGRNAQDQVNNALTQVSDTFSKWSEFQSPFNQDNASWANETFGKVEGTIDNLASNLDRLKSAEGRAELFGVLNNLNYGRLSQLRQSRDAGLARQEYNSRLAANGRFNPDWHNVDWSGYDTTQRGIFNDVSPLAYQDIRSLVSPYVDDIKPSFLRSEGGYDYTGITPETIQGVLDRNFSSITGTPAAQKHIEVSMRNNPGMNQEQATQLFYKQALQDAMYKVSEDREANPYSQAAFADQLRGAREASNLDLRYKHQQRIQALKNEGASGSQTTDPGRLTDMLTYDGSNAIVNNIASQQELFPRVSRGVEQNKTFNDLSSELQLDLRDQYNSIVGNPEISSDEQSRKLYGINSVIDNISSPISRDAEDVILSSLTTDKVSTYDGTDYVINSTKGLNLLPSLAGDIIGEQISLSSGSDRKDSNINRLNDALTKGEFSNARISGTGQQVTYMKNGKPVTGVRVRVSIPTSELDEKGFKTRGWFGSQVGSGVAAAKAIGAASESRKLSKDPQATPQDVITFDAIQEVPSDLNVQQWINQEYLNKQTSKTYSNAQYERWQERAMGLPSRSAPSQLDDLDEFTYDEDY